MNDMSTTEIEIRYSHLEKMVNDLSEVVYRQQKEIDALKEGFLKMKERLPSDTGIVDASRFDLPPHY